VVRVQLMDRNTNEAVGAEKPKKVSDLLQETLASLKPETQLEEEARLWFEELEAKRNLREMEEFYESQKSRREAGCSMWEA
tara:strand:+ start:691 stop:933 length:243 start_codon:yes stop_codon:yes gene_type:complete